MQVIHFLVFAVLFAGVIGAVVVVAGNSVVVVVDVAEGAVHPAVVSACGSDCMSASSHFS